MKQLIKRLFAAFFLGKKNTEQTEILNKKYLPLLRRQGEEKEVLATAERPQPAPPPIKVEEVKERIEKAFVPPVSIPVFKTLNEAKTALSNEWNKPKGIRNYADKNTLQKKK